MLEYVNYLDSRRIATRYDSGVALMICDRNMNTRVTSFLVLESCIGCIFEVSVCLSPDVLGPRMICRSFAATRKLRTIARFWDLILSYSPRDVPKVSLSLILLRCPFHLF